MFGLLERVRNRQAEVQDATFRTYRDAVDAVVDGADAGSPEVFDAITRAGKTPEEFAADVKRIAGRRKLRAAVDAMPKWQKKLDEINSLRSEKAAAVQKAQREYEAFVRETEPAHLECTRELDAGRHANGKLLSTADPELIEKGQACAKREGEIQSRIIALREHIQRQKLNVNSLERNAEIAANVAEAKRHELPEHQVKELRQRAEEMANTVAKTRAAIGDTTRQVADLEKELAKVKTENAVVYREMFQP